MTLLDTLRNRMALQTGALEKDTPGDAAAFSTTRLLEQLLETTQEGFWFIDNDTVTIDLNPAMCRILGLERDQVIGRTIYDFVDDENKQIFLDQIAARQKGAVGAYEVALRRADGVNIPCINNAAPIFDEAGEKIGSIGLWTDISDTKMYRQLIEESTQGILITDEDRTILYANPALADILGYGSADELMAMQTSQVFVAPHELPRINNVRRARFSGDEPAGVVEYDAIKKDGSTIHVQAVGQLTTWNGQSVIESKILDVTARHRAEKSLRDSEARYRDIVESASDWFWEMDEELRFTYMSPNVERVVGVKPEWHYGKTRQDLLGDNYDHELWDPHFRLLAARKPFRDFLYLRTGDGVEPKWLSASGVPVFDDAGNFKGYRGVGRDMTEAKRAERALEASEQRFRNFAEASADWFWESDADLRFTYVSENIERVTGMPQSKFIGRTREELYTGRHDKADWTEHLATLAARQPFRDFIYSHFDESGKQSWFKVSGTPIFDGAGTFMGYRGVGSDVTAIVEVENARSELESRFRALFDGSPAAISLKGLDGRFLMVNKTFAAWTGMQPADLVGKTVGDICTDDYATDSRDRDESVIELGEVVVVNRTIQFKDQAARPVLIHMCPIRSADGEITAIATINADLTELKHAEAQVVQADKLATLGRMAAGITHELAQPLNIIRLATQSMLMDMEDNPGTEKSPFREEIEVIDSQILRMAEIIEHMTIFARQKPAEEEVFSPLVAIENVAGFISQQFNAAGIQLDCDLGPAEAQVLGSRIQLEQVLTNLMANAGDAVAANLKSHAAGEAPAGRISVTFREDGDARALHIAITDNGGGIPAEDLPHIFDPFYTTKEVGAGTGLGLSVSASIIEKMGGDLNVENFGDGARFTITLPMAAETP